MSIEARAPIIDSAHTHGNLPTIGQSPQANPVMPVEDFTAMPPTYDNNLSDVRKKLTNEQIQAAHTAWDPDSEHVNWNRKAPPVGLFTGELERLGAMTLSDGRKIHPVVPTALPNAQTHTILPSNNNIDTDHHIVLHSLLKKAANLLGAVGTFSHSIFGGGAPAVDIGKIFNEPKTGIEQPVAKPEAQALEVQTVEQILAPLVADNSQETIDAGSTYVPDASYPDGIKWDGLYTIVQVPEEPPVLFQSKTDENGQAMPHELFPDQNLLIDEVRGVAAINGKPISVGTNNLRKGVIDYYSPSQQRHISIQYPWPAELPITSVESVPEVTDQVFITIELGSIAPGDVTTLYALKIDPITDQVTFISSEVSINRSSLHGMSVVDNNGQRELHAIAVSSAKPGVTPVIYNLETSEWQRAETMQTVFIDGKEWNLGYPASSGSYTKPTGEKRIVTTDYSGTMFLIDPVTRVATRQSLTRLLEQAGVASTIEGYQAAVGTTPAEITPFVTDAGKIVFHVSATYQKNGYSRVFTATIPENFGPNTPANDIRVSFFDTGDNPSGVRKIKLEKVEGKPAVFVVTDGVGLVASIPKASKVNPGQIEEGGPLGSLKINKGLTAEKPATPTATVTPTSSPTKTPKPPTVTPTWDDTKKPTFTPTATATLETTNTPIVPPTNSPTEKPATATETPMPTPTVTSQPEIVTPTSSPTVTPTSSPTKTPKPPTVTPTWDDTKKPTFTPTEEPGERHSVVLPHVARNASRPAGW